MKKYTFNIDNKKTSNGTSNNDYSKIIDNCIFANVIKNNPYLAGTIDDDFIFIDTSKLKKEINIDITIPKSKPNKSYSIDIFCKKPKKDYTLELNDTYDSMLKVIDYIYSILSKPEKKDYDFKLADGTPVKFFDDEIQIGYDLIPLNGFTKTCFDGLDMKTRKTILDLYITLAA